jgi:hypothetical protein
MKPSRRTRNPPDSLNGSAKALANRFNLFVRNHHHQAVALNAKRDGVTGHHALRRTLTHDFQTGKVERRLPHRHVARVFDSLLGVDDAFFQ